MTKRQTMTKEQTQELDDLIKKYSNLPKDKQELMKEAAIMASPLGDVINKLEKLAYEMARIVAKHSENDTPINSERAIGTLGAVGVVVVDIRESLIEETVKYVENVTTQMFAQLTGQSLPSKQDKENLEKAIELLNKVTIYEDDQKKNPPNPPSEKKETKTVH